MEHLSLTRADAGEQRSTPADTERLSGVVERIQQHGQERVLLMRLDDPTPGVALIGTSGAGARTNASVGLYFYGDDAEARAASSSPKWQAWLQRFTAAMPASG